MSIDYEKIKRLIALLEENLLTEIAVEEDDFSITIKAESATDNPGVAPMPAAQPDTRVEVRPAEAAQGRQAPAGPASVQTDLSPEHLFQITSPMIGVFYRRPSPDSPSYVEVGDEIEVGQTVGIIEAMKVFNEVPSEAAGRVAAIPAENGKLVQQGDTLVVVDTSANT